MGKSGVRPHPLAKKWQSRLKRERTNRRIFRPYHAHEAAVHRILEGRSYVPTLLEYGHDGNWNYLAMTRLGTSDGYLLGRSGERFSLRNTLATAIKTIACIEYVHSKGLIHRDIKPENFLFAIGDRANDLHIIHFGLARCYENLVTHQHYTDDADHLTSMIGTERYASVNSLDCRAPLGIPPRRHRTAPTASRPIKKLTWTSGRLCGGFPTEFALLLEYTRGLAFDAKPDYAYLKKLFRDLFYRLNYVDMDQIDWSDFPKPKESRGVQTTDRSLSPSTMREVATSIRSIDWFSHPEDQTTTAVRRGDLILVLLLARATIEGTLDCSAPDGSYWHDPALSAPQWQFSYRPAVALGVRRERYSGHIRIATLPIMDCNEGLGSIPEDRRGAFVALRGASEIADGALLLPSWPFTNTYVYHTPGYEAHPHLKFLVDPEDLSALKVHWHVESEDVQRILALRTSLSHILYENTSANVLSNTLRRISQSHAAA